MKLATLRKKGFTLLSARIYKVQTQQSGSNLIVLAPATLSDGKKYYQAIDANRNILLIEEDNLEL